MFCPKCGSQIAPGNKFCTVCGNPVYADAADATGKTQILNESYAAAEESYEALPEENPETVYAPAKIEPARPPRPPKKHLSKGKKAAIIISVILALIIGLGVTGFILVENSPAKEVVILLDKGKYERAVKIYKREVEDNFILDKLCQSMLTKQFDAKAEDFLDGEMKYDEAIEYFSAILKMKALDKDEITEKLIDAIYARCNALQEKNMSDEAREEYYALIEFGEDKLDGFDRSCMAKPKPPEPTPEPSTPYPAESFTPEPPEEPTDEPIVLPPIEISDNRVVVGLDTEADGNWAFAFEGSDIAADNAIISLTNDCQTVIADKNGNYIINPAVVEEYNRSVSACGDVTYMFKIKEDLVFNNGEPIKAENFLIWTLFANSSAGEYLDIPGNWDKLFGRREYNSGEVNYFSGLRLIDDYAFSVTVNAEMFPYYYEISYFNMRAVNIPYWFGDYDWHVKDDGEGAYIECKSNPSFLFTKENIADAFYEAEYSCGNCVTAGPYNLVYFNPDSGQAILQINENYNGNFEGRKPVIQHIVIKYVPEDEALGALTNGEIDFYPKITGGNKVNAALELIENGEFDGNYCQFDRAGYGYIGFACDFGPTQWTEFRQAVAYLIDRDEFANTFCKGWGKVVHGPYGAAFTMYKDNREYVEYSLNHYDFNPEKAVELLKKIGFTLNADGTHYVDGSGLLRYKEVTAKEGKYYGDENLGWNITLADGRILMPARINWCSSINNEVSELLSIKLADSDAVKNAGIEIVKTETDFDTLVSWLYRQNFLGIGGADYSIPTYNMFNLATSWIANIFDDSYVFTTNPDLIAVYNVTRLLDEQLNKLSMDMVYTVPAGDYAGYVEIWKQYIVRWNELLPQIPLYSNIYVTVFPNTLTNYRETAFWGWERAILYADFVG